MRKPKQEEVTLNVTAMLDMAFQLLAFFVFTFKPPPLETNIRLRMPAALPVIGQGAASPGQDPVVDPKVKPVKALIVRLTDDSGNGSLSEVSIGISDQPLQKITRNQLDSELQNSIQKQGYEQLTVQFTPTLHWEEVMKVMDKCAKLTSKDGKPPSLTLDCLPGTE